jgi:hypothetical protein
MNDDEPSPPLNSRAKCVSYPPVFHEIELHAELEFVQGCLWLESRRWIEDGQRDGSRRISRGCRSFCGGRREATGPQIVSNLAAAGGLMSYGTDNNDQFRLAAFYVDHILRGEKPADLRSWSWPALLIPFL